MAQRRETDIGLSGGENKPDVYRTLRTEVIRSFWLNYGREECIVSESTVVYPDFYVKMEYIAREDHRKCKSHSTSTIKIGLPPPTPTYTNMLRRTCSICQIAMEKLSCALDLDFPVAIWYMYCG
jgi:hypothetical protein